jgi:hypothetical protein
LKDHETGEFKTIRGKWFENRRLISGAGYGKVTLIARTPSIGADEWQEQDWVTKGKPPLLDETTIVKVAILTADDWWMVDKNGWRKGAK